MPDLSRRQLLKSAGIAAAAVATGFAVRRVVVTDKASVSLSPDFEALIVGGRYSPDLGEAYLGDRIPRNLQTYEGLIEETVRSLPRGDLEADVARVIAADFATGRICDVNGWQLALIECRLAAIAYFYRANGGRIEEDLQVKDPLDALPDADIAQVERWGPQSTPVGEPFNRQPDGDSAVWMRLAEVPEHNLYLVYLGTQIVRGRASRERKLITASLSAEQVKSLIAAPGEIPIHLVDPVKGKQLVGHLAVRPRPGGLPIENRSKL